MGHVFESAKVHPLVVPELAIAHVAVVSDDFTDVLWGQILHTTSQR